MKISTTRRLSITRRRAFPSLLLLQLVLATNCKRAVAVADVQESKNASPFQRVVSGALRGLDLVHRVLDPSRILASSSSDITPPTKMKVSFVGLGRTGTTSLSMAMGILGYRCVDDDTSSAVMDLYADLYKDKITSLDQVYKEIGKRGFNCTFLYTDYEWAAKQEDVKVVLSTRDPEKWAESWLSVTDSYTVITSPPFSWIPLIRGIRKFHDVLFKEIPTGGHPDGWQDRETLVKGYGIHRENVINAVPEDRLLVFSVKEGWEPLCEFLGVPVPDSPFPHVNDRFKMKVTIQTFKVISWIWPLAFLLPLLLIWKLFGRLTRSAKNKDSKGIKSD